MNYLVTFVVALCLTTNILVHCEDVLEESSVLSEKELGTEKEILEHIDDSDDREFDVARMLGDLIEHTEDGTHELSSNREGRQTDELEEKSAKYEPSVIAKYNSFIDAFLRRLSTSMRADNDPINIIVRKSGRVTGRKTNNNNKNRNTKRRNKNNRNKNNRNKNNRNKNTKRKNNGEARKRTNRRHPKDIKFDEEKIENEEGSKDEAAIDEEGVEGARTAEGEGTEGEGKEGTEGGEEEGVEGEEDEGEEETGEDETNVRNKREIDNDEDIDGDEEDEDEAEDETDVSVRNGRDIGQPIEEDSEASGKSSSDVNRRGKVSPPRRRRRKKGSRKGKCGKKCKIARRRRRLRKNGNKKNNRNRRSAPASTAILSGISSIRREGDVRIVDNEGAQDIIAQIIVGPVILKAEKKVGKGAKKTLMKAEAMSPEVKGKMIISVKANGNARIKTLKLFRPTVVSVNGSVRKDSSTSDKYMQRFMAKSSSLVGRKLSLTAKSILKLPKKNKNKRKQN